MSGRGLTTLRGLSQLSIRDIIVYVFFALILDFASILLLRKWKVR